MKKLIGMVLVTSCVLAGLACVGHRPPDAQAAFFASLERLCGATFVGAMTFPAEPSHDFAGKRLVTKIAHCEKKEPGEAGELRVPFSVGDDTSRTWILTLAPGSLSLQHDHRHADGTPDEITLYGGQARPGGSSHSQSFPADAYTARLIPAATTNVWTLSLSDDHRTLTYHLERNGQPRFTAVLHRVP